MARNLIKLDRTECPSCGHNHTVQELWDYFDASNAENSVIYHCAGCQTKIVISLNVNGYIVLRNVKPKKRKVE